MSMKKIKRMAGLTVLNLIFIIICLLALIRSCMRFHCHSAMGVPG